MELLLTQSKSSKYSAGGIYVARAAASPMNAVGSQGMAKSYLGVDLPSFKARILARVRKHDLGTFWRDFGPMIVGEGHVDACRKVWALLRCLCINPMYPCLKNRLGWGRQSTVEGE